MKAQLSRRDVLLRTAAMATASAIPGVPFPGVAARLRASSGSGEIDASLQARVDASAFLPEFFQTIRGLTLVQAGSLTALIPLAGVFAAAGAGLMTGAIGLRRPFTYPMQILFGLGCLGSVTFTSLAAIRISLILIGVGSSALLPALLTMVMELPGMTPTKAGSGLGVVWAAGYTGAFLSPFIGGALAGRFGLEAVMVGSLVFALVAIGGFYMVPETGRGRMAPRSEAVLRMGKKPELRQPD